MLLDMNLVDEIGHEVSNLPEQSDPEDYFPWACIEVWPSKFQPTEAKCISKEGELPTNENNHIISVPPKKLCKNTTLNKEN